MRKHIRRYGLPGLILAVGGVMAVETTQVLATPADEVETSERSPSPAKVTKKIDRLMAAAWRAEKIKPRRAATDAEFLRRASLDIAGVIPSEDQTRRFLKSKKHDKRGALIQELLKSEDYARTMGLRYAYLLVGRDYLIRAKTVKQVMKARRMRRRMMGGGVDEGMPGYDPNNLEILTLTEWLGKHFQENTSWGKVASQLIAAEGTVTKNPATHYMLKHMRNGKAAEITGSVMKVFQGIQLQCAQCHTDKMNPKLTQRVFYGVAAYFSRVAVRRTLPPGVTRQMAKKNPKLRGPFEIWDRPRGQIRIPAPPGEVGRLVLPEFFVNGRVTNPGNLVKRRQELAKMIVSKKNPYFAKATVNRVWSFFFNRGIVNPVDAVNQKDHPLPKVLELLEEDFKRSNYDMRRLVEIIVNSRAYGLSSAGPEEGKEDELTLFARAPIRSLTAEQLFYSVLEATGMEDIRTGNRRQKRRLERMKFFLLRKFVRTFSEDESDEEVDEGTIPQALMRLNGPLTNDAVRARPGHPVYDRLFRMRKLDSRINAIYLRVLSRFPTKAERKTLKKYLKTKRARYAAGQAQAYADVFWALLNSSEFNLNH